MQIDRYNFAQYYDKICDNLKRADFVSFDCQFSGLVTNIEKIENKFPDHRDFYQRIKQTSLNFKILQLGLSIFIFNQKKKAYDPYQYNFFILPYVNQPGFNNIMVSQVDSLAFLSQHGIDWNRIFKKGIIPQRLITPFGYKNHQYDKFYTPKQNEYFFSKQDKQFIDKIQTTLQKVSDKKSQELIDFRKNSIYNYFMGKYQDKLILAKGKKAKGKLQFFVSTAGSLNNNQEDDIVFEQTEKNTKYVQKKISQQKQKQQAEEHLNNNNINKVSIQNLLKIITDNQIPIVGHFPSLDLGLVYHTYFQALPQAFQQFCSKINKLFPQIYDTKILSRRVASDFKSMKVNLPSLYSACQNPKYLEPYCNVIQNKLLKQSQNRHQAGYDSYLTGYAFVGMANYINENNQKDPINFKMLKDLNNVIYSRDTGQMLLRQPYCPASLEYDRKILIWNDKKENKLWLQIAQQLSKYGTLYTTEDHGQTYFVFEEENDKIETILKQFSKQSLKLLPYRQRRILKARDIYKRCQQQLYINNN